MRDRGNKAGTKETGGGEISKSPDLMNVLELSHSFIFHSEGCSYKCPCVTGFRHLSLCLFRRLPNIFEIFHQYVIAGNFLSILSTSSYNNSVSMIIKRKLITERPYFLFDH